MDPPLVDELLGRTIAGKYRVDSLVGRGAMGSVYRAKQLALNKSVAIKVINPDRVAAKTFTARFKREAKAASRLDHPNLVRVIDFGEEEGGRLYLVMEFLEGKDLFRTLAEEFPLPKERIVSVLSQTLAALAAAHEVGVIHRDLKPENIMLTTVKDDEGNLIERVKVLDFGIAKILEPDEETGGLSFDNTKSLTATNTGTLTRHGMLIGTPEYMSPEQARGEPADARSDLYSTGVILYQLLAGRLPFQAASKIRLVIKHVEEEPPPPSSFDSQIDLRLEAACMKALQKRPDARFQTAREMRAAIRAAVADGQGPASSSSMPAMRARSSFPGPEEVPESSAAKGSEAVLAKGPEAAPPRLDAPKKEAVRAASTADPSMTARALLEARRRLAEEPPKIQQRVSSAPPSGSRGAREAIVIPVAPKVPSSFPLPGQNEGRGPSWRTWALGLAVLAAVAVVAVIATR